MALSEQIIQVLEFLCEKLGIAVDWTTENVAPYLQIISQRIITYSIVVDIFWIVLGIIFCILAILMIKYAVKHWDDWEDNPLVILGILFGCVILLIGVVMSLVNIYELCVCIAFPELQIIEFIGRYIN